jgi:Ca-activated chloride channel family protein
MKLRTASLIGATCMIATAALVWISVDPARGSATTANAPPAPVPPVPAKPAVAPVVVDHSTFTAGKTLLVSGRLGHKILPADADSQTFVFADVSGDVNAKATTGAPLDLAIAIDRSGSMSGKKLDNALAAARTAINRLRDGDVVSVMVYNTNVETLVQPTVIDAASRERALKAIGHPAAMGDTCISCALLEAQNLLRGRESMVGRVLLLSDGVATAGVRDQAGFERIAEDTRALGASISTIGVGVDYDERVMASLARASNGDHFFVASPTDLASIFDKEMDSLQKTVAARAELVVDLAPGVVAEQVFDRTTASTDLGSQVVVPLGTFGAGEHKTVLIKVRVPRGQAGERPVAQVRLRYDDLVTGKDGSCDGALVAQLSSDPAQLTPLDAIVSARLSSTETAEALEEANQLFRNGQTAQAQEVLRRREAELRPMAHMAHASASPPATPAVDAAFDKQTDALRGASTGFGSAAASSAGGHTAEAKTKGDNQIRASQKDAFDLSN